MRRLLVILLLLVSLPVWGVDYYVDFDTGDNSNDGLTLGNAWKEAPGTQDPTDTPTDGWADNIPVGSRIIFTAGQTWTRPVVVDFTWYDGPTEEGERITLTSSTQLLIDRPQIDLSGYTSYAYGVEVKREYVTVEYLEILDLTHAGETYGFYAYNSDYVKLLYSYVHDIQDSIGQNSVGAGSDASAYTEIAYCEIKNTEIKLITYGSGDHNTAHHNLLHQDEGFTGTGLDHGVVYTQDYGEFHHNILWTDQTPSDTSYAFKIDGANDGTFANNNLVYNNLVLKWPSGMAAMDVGTGGNVFYSNTIYLQGVDGVSSTFYDLHGFALMASGGVLCKGNTIKNNIIYYPKKATAGGSNYSHMMRITAASANVADNTVENNLLYYNGSDERLIEGTTTRTLAWFETGGNWNGLNGNVMQNNTIATPGLVGGTHVVSNLPTGFTAGWVPNDSGLELTGNSNAKDAGATLDSPYDVDIAGVSRPQGAVYDIGAYEYMEAAGTSEVVLRNRRTMMIVAPEILGMMLHMWWAQALIACMIFSAGYIAGRRMERRHNKAWIKSMSEDADFRHGMYEVWRTLGERLDD
jgi:hypothetical protein